MRDTSLEAFQSLKLDAVEGVKKAILESLQHSPATSAQVAHRLKITEYQASKRTSDLLREGKIIRGNVGTNPSGRRAYILHAIKGWA